MRAANDTNAHSTARRAFELRVERTPRKYMAMQGRQRRRTRGPAPSFTLAPFEPDQRGESLSAALPIALSPANPPFWQAARRGDL